MTLLKRLKNFLDKWVIISIIAVLVVLLGSFLYQKSVVKVEYTFDESLPYNVWISLPYKEKPYIEFSVYWNDKYFKKGTYLVKILACDEGHYLKVDENKNYYCDGIFLGKAVDTDKQGNPVENFKWDGPVPKGKAFVIGTHKRSYDSRYFGFIDKSKIEKYLYPLK